MLRFFNLVVCKDGDPRSVQFRANKWQVLGEFSLLTSRAVGRISNDLTFQVGHIFWFLYVERGLALLSVTQSWMINRLTGSTSCTRWSSWISQSSWGLSGFKTAPSWYSFEKSSKVYCQSHQRHCASMQLLLSDLRQVETIEASESEALHSKSDWTNEVPYAARRCKFMCSANWAGLHYFTWIHYNSSLWYWYCMKCANVSITLCRCGNSRLPFMCVRLLRRPLHHLPHVTTAFWSLTSPIVWMAWTTWVTWVMMSVALMLLGGFRWPDVVRWGCWTCSLSQDQTAWWDGVWKAVWPDKFR